MKTPDWSHSEIRIKPEPKPDRIEIRHLSYNPVVIPDPLNITPNGLHLYCTDHLAYLRGSLKFIFDGETLELKDVEIIK